MYHQIARNKRNSIIVVVLFILFWLLAGFVIGEFGGGGVTSAVGGALILGILGICAALYSYYLGSATVLSAAGAHEADRGQFAQLYNIVETLAIGDGVPPPKVYIIEDPSPNAFATGRDPKHAAVTVTTTSKLVTAPLANAPAWLQATTDVVDVSVHTQPPPEPDT